MLFYFDESILIIIFNTFHLKYISIDCVSVINIYYVFS